MLRVAMDPPCGSHRGPLRPVWILPHVRRHMPSIAQYSGGIEKSTPRQPEAAGDPRPAGRIGYGWEIKSDG
jgi:hypothetical protein